jgi:hypothetical protein
VKPPTVSPAEEERIAQARRDSDDARRARIQAAVEASLSDEAVRRREAKDRLLSRRISRREKKHSGRGW